MNFNMKWPGLEEVMVKTEKIGEAFYLHVEIPRKSHRVQHAGKEQAGSMLTVSKKFSTLKYLNEHLIYFIEGVVMCVLAANALRNAILSSNGIKGTHGNGIKPLVCVSFKEKILKIRQVNSGRLLLP